MTMQRYTFGDAPFTISTIPTGDDVIITINNFPLGFSVYLTKVDAHALAEQIKMASLTKGDGDE